MSRSFGTIQLDDGVNTFPDKGGLITFPNARDVEAPRIINRNGRLSWVKDDVAPLTISLTGYWLDGGGKYWRDFVAALLGQPRTTLTRGDGTRYEWVDCVEVKPKLIGGTGAGTATPNQAQGYVAKCISYEPVARDIGPSLISLGNLTTGAGSQLTTFTINYPGSFFAEPTWQFYFVVPGGQTLNSVSLANAQTGETCTWTPSSPLGVGTYYLLMDASGGTAGQTPSNNQYNVLAGNTLGRGVGLYTSSMVDQDFTGQMPTLIPGGTMTIPPTPFGNQITATVNASGALTTATLSYVAPSRWWR